MTIFALFLRWIKHFHLLETPDYIQLVKDVKGWEDSCTPDNENKLKAIYGKIHHDSIYVRLLLPFLFFFGVKELRNMMEGSDKEKDDNFFDDNQ